jgi:hypothetical protein
MDGMVGIRAVAAGKPKMDALVACMRKLLILLNAMIREGKTWDQLKQWVDKQDSRYLLFLLVSTISAVIPQQR